VIIRLLLALFSAGWILPMWLAVFEWLKYWNREFLPESRGNPPLDSFPHAIFATDLFTVACIWLALVIFYWAWRLSAR
jgi:hypothetical protein